MSVCRSLCLSACLSVCRYVCLARLSVGRSVPSRGVGATSPDTKSEIYFSDELHIFLVMIGSRIQNRSVLWHLTLVACFDGFVGSFSSCAGRAPVTDFARAMWHITGHKGTSCSFARWFYFAVGAILPDGSIEHLQTQGLVEGSVCNAVITWELLYQWVEQFSVRSF